MVIAICRPPPRGLFHLECECLLDDDDSLPYRDAGSLQHLGDDIYVYMYIHVYLYVCMYVLRTASTQTRHPKRIFFLFH